MPTVRAVGTFASGTAALAVPTPAGVASGDLLLTLLEYSTGLGTNHVTATGWTEIAWRDQVAATGRTDLSLMGRIADGTEGASQTFTPAGTINHVGGRMIAITVGTHGVATLPTDITVGTITGGAAAGGSPQTNSGIPGVTAPAGSLAILAAVSARDANWTGTEFSGWAMTDPATLTEQMDNGTLSGNGGGLGMATDTTASGTTGNGSYVQANAEAWNAVIVAIKPAAAALVPWVNLSGRPFAYNQSTDTLDTIPEPTGFELDYRPRSMLSHMIQAPPFVAGGPVTITPDGGTLTWTGAAAVLQTTITPTAGTLSWTGAAASLGTKLTPTAGVLTWTGAAAGLRTTLTPTAGTLTWTGAAAGLRTTLTPSAGALTWTGAAASLLSSLTPTAGVLTWSGQTAVLSATGGQTITPDAGLLTWSGQTAILTATSSTVLTPTAALLTWTGGAAIIPAPPSPILIITYEGDRSGAAPSGAILREGQDDALSGAAPSGPPLLEGMEGTTSGAPAAGAALLEGQDGPRSGAAPSGAPLVESE